MIIKNRNREDYSFANINLLGKCNASCFFCLGKDIEDLLSKQNQVSDLYMDWKNFFKFLDICKEKGVEKIYITGQNTDSLMYKYLDELVSYLQNTHGFSIGLRTNGYLAPRMMDTINKCRDEIGYSVQTLDPEANFKILGRRDIPNWDKIIPETNNPRVSIVVNEYNVDEFFDVVKYLSKFDNIRYIQARRISTDTRYDLLKPHIDVYEKLFGHVEANHEKIGDFYQAQRYNIYGKEVCFWRTVQTSVNSLNYFTDGTISEAYFVVEGYQNNYQKTEELKGI